MKKVLAVLLAMAMVFGLAACGGAPITDTPAATDSSSPAAPAAADSSASSAEDDGIIRIGRDLEFCDTLDVWDNSIIYTFESSDAIFDRLFNKNSKTMELELNLLEDWPEISADGKTYTFKLKKGVLFHDGVELTSKDVEFTFNYFYAKDTASINTWVCGAIEGCDEMMEGTADTLSGFKVIDDYTFEITLKYAYSAFESILATSMLPILPAHLRADAGDAWGTTVLPVGTGPYKCVAFEPQQKIVLETFQDYHGGARKCAGIEVLHMTNETALMEFEAGNIDFAAVNSDLVPDYSARFPENFHDIVVAGTIRLSLNVSLAPLDNPLVRKALYMAIDRDAICDGYFSGNVKKINGIIPDGIPGFDADAPGYEYDPAAAKALLAEAGYPDGIEVTATVRDASNDRFVLELIQDQVKEAGITFNVEKVDAASVTEMRQNGQIQIFFYDWYADYMDADMFLYTFFYSGYSDAESICLHDDWLDEQLNAARNMSDAAAKAELYAQIDSKLAYEDVVFIPLYQDKSFYLSSDRVENLGIMKDMLCSVRACDIK